LRGYETFLYEIDRNLERRARRAFGRAALQNPKPSIFDGEFNVLEAPLELGELATELGGDGGRRLRELRLSLWTRPARDHILALRLEQHVDHWIGIAG
jgi:hypothetical protein